MVDIEITCPTSHKQSPWVFFRIEESCVFRLQLINVARSSSKPSHYFKNILERPQPEYQNLEKKKSLLESCRNITLRQEVEGTFISITLSGEAYRLNSLDLECQGMLGFKKEKRKKIKLPLPLWSTWVPSSNKRNNTWERMSLVECCLEIKWQRSSKMVAPRQSLKWLVMWCQTWGGSCIWFTEVACPKDLEFPK